MLGARFGPGGARAWLGLPMDEIVGQAVELRDLLGPRALELSQRMGDAPGQGARQALFQSGLEHLGRDAAVPDPRAAQLFGLAGAAGVAGAIGDEIQVLAAMRAQVGMSERSLRRLCHAQFGYGPKTLERVLRFQRLLSLARTGGWRLAELALHAGYADQAHLSREVRALCGMSASAALAHILG